MKRAIKNILLFVLTGFLGIFIMEGYVRYAEIEPLSNFEVDSVHGKKLRPDLPMVYMKEGFYMGETNEYGYLGPGYPPEKEEEIYRIALIGDSYVEAFHVFDRYHFRSVLEDNLSRLKNDPIEVMNFGRSGFMLKDMYVYYQHFAASFHPDKLLVFVHNDDFYEESHQSLLPTVKLRDDSLVIKNDFVNSQAFWNYRKTEFFRENSVYLKIVNNCYKLLKKGKFNQIVLGKLNQLLQQTHKTKSKKRMASQEKKQEIPTINRRIIQQLAKSKNTVLVLGDNPKEQVQQLIDSSGINTIQLCPVMEKLTQEGIRPTYWEATNQFGHWNHQAHAAIGKTLAEKLNANNHKATH